jgi:hypothetical protein
MKRIVLVLLFAVLGTVGKAQSRADYDQAMGTVMELFNKSDADGLKALYKDFTKVPKEEVMDKEKLKELKTKLGEMSTYKYIGDNNERIANLYKVEFQHGTEVVGIALDVEGKITSLRFEKKSPTTERLMRVN